MARDPHDARRNIGDLAQEPVVPDDGELAGPIPPLAFHADRPGAFPATGVLRKVRTERTP